MRLIPLDRGIFAVYGDIFFVKFGKTGAELELREKAGLLLNSAVLFAPF